MLAILAALLVVLGLAFHFLLPVFAAGFIRGQLETASDRLGREVTFERFELVQYHRYVFHGLTVGGSEADPTPLFHADSLRVTLDRTALFRRRVVLRGLSIENPTVTLSDGADGRSNYADLVERIRGDGSPEAESPVNESPSGTDEPRPAGARRIDLLCMGLPRVHIEGGVLDLSRAAPPALEAALPELLPELPSRISDIALDVEPAGSDIAASFELHASFDGVEAGPSVRLPNSLSVSGHVAPEDDVLEVMFDFAEPVQVSSLPGAESIVFRFGDIGYEHPHAARLRDLEILDGRTQSPVVLIPELMVRFEERPEGLEGVLEQVSLVETSGIRLYAQVDQYGRTNVSELLGIDSRFPLGSLFPEPPLANPVDGDATDPVADATQDADDGAEPAAERTRLCRSRRWWNCFPQTLEVNDVALELVLHEDGRTLRTLDVTLPRLRTGQRLLNFQMDLVAEVAISEREIGELGSIAVDFIYYWREERWSLDLDMSDLQLAALVDLSPEPPAFAIESGTLNGSVGITDNRETSQSVDSRGDFRLADFTFGRADEPEPLIQGLDLAYGFDATFEQDGGLLRMERGELALGDVAVEAWLEMDGLDVDAFADYLATFGVDDRGRDYWRERSELAPPFAETRIHVDMPPQPANDVLAAVPEVLRRRLEGTELTGTLGWRFHPVVTAERRENGRLEFTIPEVGRCPPLDDDAEPPVGCADLLDDDLGLEHLPRDIDVRRLNNGFRFTFVDGIGERRELTVGAANPRWVALEDISEMMTASILNTEDQSFFRNGGFNWFQMRSVIARALEEMELGRGASTISMQLVKNVFLSRERELGRKFSELFLTYWMNEFVPKERVLEVYLNIIEFGPGINGIAEAAEHYFGKLPIDLTLGECVFLVSIVPGPRRYHYFYEQGEISDRWWAHMQRYFDRMLAREVITQEDYDNALLARPEFYLPEDGEPSLRPDEPEPPPDIVIPMFGDPLGADRGSQNQAQEALHQIREIVRD